MFHNHFVSWWWAVFASSAKGKIYELKSEGILNFVNNVALHCSMFYVALNCIVIHCRLQRDALLWVWYVLHCMIIVITGRYTHKLGLQNSNLPKCTDQELDENVDTIADMLKGTYHYKTHMIGMYNLYRLIYIRVTIWLKQKITDYIPWITDYIVWMANIDDDQWHGLNRSKYFGAGVLSKETHRW